MIDGSWAAEENMKLVRYEQIKGRLSVKSFNGSTEGFLDVYKEFPE